MTNRVIATKDINVFDDKMGFERKLFAGQPVPPDLVDAYQKATGENVQATETSTDPFAQHVADSSIKDLLAEVDGDQAAAQRVLAAEQARGDDARATLVEALEKQLADPGE